MIFAENYPNKKHRNLINAPTELLGREDRKYGDQSGNRVLCRFYNQGSIGDQSSSFSGVYPIGSGHAYISVSYTHLTLPTILLV